MNEAKNSVTYSVKTPNGYEVLFTLRDDTTEGILMQMQKLEKYMITNGYEPVSKSKYPAKTSYSGGSSYQGNSELATEKQISLIKAKWPSEYKEGMTKKEANNLISQKYGN